MVSTWSGGTGSSSGSTQSGNIGIGFAIPADVATRVAGRVEGVERCRRPRQDLREPLQPSAGVQEPQRRFWLSTHRTLAGTARPSR